MSTTYINSPPLYNAPYVLPISVEEVLSHYWDKALPVNPIQIAQRMGVDVFQSDSLKEIDELINGAFLYANDTNKPTIIFRHSGNSQRDRFTIAHELGHFCCGHPTSLRHAGKQFDQYNYDLNEVAANKFAASLLMPHGFVLDAIHRKGMTSLAELSSYFDVSLTAMNIRLERMGII